MYKVTIVGGKFKEFKFKEDAEAYAHAIGEKATVSGGKTTKKKSDNSKDEKTEE